MYQCRLCNRLERVGTNLASAARTGRCLPMEMTALDRATVS